MDKTGNCASFLDILECASLDKSSFDLFAMMTSEIWMRRNKIRLGEPTLPLGQISSLACVALQEHHQLRLIHAKIPRTARSVR